MKIPSPGTTPMDIFITQDQTAGVLLTGSFPIAESAAKTQTFHLAGSEPAAAIVGTAHAF